MLGLVVCGVSLPEGSDSLLVVVQVLLEWSGYERLGNYCGQLPWQVLSSAKIHTSLEERGC